VSPEPRALLFANVAPKTHFRYREKMAIMKGVLATQEKTILSNYEPHAGGEVGVAARFGIFVGRL
jgi:hypothetical protein